MKNAFCVFLFLCAVACSAQTPTLDWAAIYTGNSGLSDQFNDLVVDGQGNILATGTTEVAGQGANYLTVKYNASGDTVWTRTFNGSANGDDVAYGVDVDASGNVYVTGKSSATGAGYDYATLKYDASGAVVWTKYYNDASGGDDIGRLVKVDPTGSFVYALGSIPPTGTVSASIYLVKYNTSDGSVASQGTLPGNSWTYNAQAVPSDIDVRNDGLTAVGATVTGPFSGNTYLYTNSWSNPTTSTGDIGTGINDVQWDGDFVYVTGSVYDSTFIGKFNNDLASYTWRQYPNHAGVLDEGVALVAKDNFIYVCAYYDTDPSPVVHDNIVVYKYDHNGNQIWATPLPSIGNAKPVAIALGSQLSPEVYLTGNVTLPDGTQRIASLALGNSGSLLWDTAFACADAGSAHATASTWDSYNNLYCAGYSTCDGSTDALALKWCAHPPLVNAGSAVQACKGVPFTLSGSGGGVYLWSPTTGLDNPSAGTTTGTLNTLGTYTYVLAINSLGCAASDSVTVTVHSLPEVTVSANPSSVCAGDSVVLTASGATTYTWTPVGAVSASANTAVATPTTNTTFVVTGTDANGCTDAAQQAVAVQTIDPVIEANGATLSVSGVSGSVTYQWYYYGTLISGATNATYDAGENEGVYTVMVTNVLSGCSGTSPEFHFSTVGISTVSDLPIAIFPNPSTGTIHYAFGQTVDLHVTNTLGHVVVDLRQIQTGTMELPVGVYMFGVSSPTIYPANQLVMIR